MCVCPVAVSLRQVANIPGNLWFRNFLHANSTRHFFTPANENLMALTPPTMIEVKRTKGKGRGVYARVAIPAGTVFERAPLLIMADKEALESEHSTVMPAYVFEYGKGKVALALGFGSLYNHSYKPNARYDDAPSQVKEFRALRDIKAGEEITINYNGAEDIMDPVEFNVVES